MCLKLSSKPIPLFSLIAPINGAGSTNTVWLGSTRGQGTGMTPPRRAAHLVSFWRPEGVPTSPEVNSFSKRLSFQLEWLGVGRAPQSEGHTISPERPHHAIPEADNPVSSTSRQSLGTRALDSDSWCPGVIIIQRCSAFPIQCIPRSKAEIEYSCIDFF